MHVQVAGARYPVVIDPFVQQAKLTASDGAGDDLFGNSVGISGDTVVVGAPLADVDGKTNQGAAYVFADMPPTPHGHGNRHGYGNGDNRAD